MSEKPPASVEAGAPSSAGTLGLPAAVALIMGSIVGTGIFTLPSAVAQYGMAGLVGFLAATVGAIALALVFASLSRRILAQGGPYAYAREGFGDVAGFINAWSYWCAAWPGNAGIVVSWVFYVQALFGWDPDNRVQSIIIALARKSETGVELLSVEAPDVGGVGVLSLIHPGTGAMCRLTCNW